MAIIVEIQQYPNTKVAVFRSGGVSVYAPLSEAQHLLDRGNYTWQEVCDLPTPAAARRERLQRRDSLSGWAGEYAAATAYPADES